MLFWIDAGTQRLPRLVGLTKALEMILVRQCLNFMVGLSMLWFKCNGILLLKHIDM